MCIILYPAILSSHQFLFIPAHKIIQFFLNNILIFHRVTASPTLNTKTPEKTQGYRNLILEKQQPVVVCTQQNLNI